MSSTSVIEYLNGLNIDPTLSYSEQSTRAISLNYLATLQDRIDAAVLGNTAAACVGVTQQLRVSTLGIPYEQLCVDRTLRTLTLARDVSHQLLAAAVACIAAIVLLVAGIKNSPL